jgi:hypothetical protein
MLLLWAPVLSGFDLLPFYFPFCACNGMPFTCLEGFFADFWPFTLKGLQLPNHRLCVPLLLPVFIALKGIVPKNQEIEREMATQRGRVLTSSVALWEGPLGAKELKRVRCHAFIKIDGCLVVHFTQLNEKSSCRKVLGACPASFCQHCRWIWLPFGKPLGA